MVTRGTTPACRPQSVGRGATKWGELARSGGNPQAVEYGSDPLSFSAGSPGPPQDPANGAAEVTEPETLDQAWLMALAADQRLEAARRNVSASQLELQAARAERWPSSSLEGGCTVRDNELSTLIESPLTPFPTPFVPRENFSFESRVSLPLYTGGRITNRIDAAAAGVSASQWDLQERVLDLKMRVAEDYVGVLRAEQELVVARSYVRSLEAHTRDVEMLLRHDRAATNDLLQSQVALADGQYQAIRAVYELESRRAAYNRQLGRPLDAPVHVAPLPVPPAAQQPEALMQLALERRPEIAQLAAQANSLRSQAQSVAAQQRAQIHLQGADTYEENRFRHPQGITTAGIGLQWQAFDACRTRRRAESLCERARPAAATSATCSRSFNWRSARPGWLSRRLGNACGHRGCHRPGGGKRASRSPAVPHGRRDQHGGSGCRVPAGAYLPQLQRAQCDAVLAGVPALRRATGTL